MAGSLRGSLGLKSGPLAPTSAKLTTQYLVLDHMNNHYRKINKAKPAIDNRPPKSIAQSQKVRERKERDHIKKQGTSRPTSRMSVRPVSRNDVDAEYYDEAEWDEPEDDDERLVYDIMRTTLRENYPASADATYGSGQRPRGQSPRWFQQNHQIPGSGSGQQSTDLLQTGETPFLCEIHPLHAKQWISHQSHGQSKEEPRCDLLQKRSHVFTEPEKPFTPRTLKSNRQSRLSEYKYYNPPPKKPSHRHDDMEQTSRQLMQTERDYRPKPKPRGTAVQDRTGTQTLSESQLMFETLQSRDFNRHQGEKDGVPKLDISVDKDHMNWLQEQASKAQIRMNNGMKAPMDQIDETEQPAVNGTMRSSPGDPRLTKSFGTKSLNRQRMSEADEEQQYVMFAKQVTEEVLNRGIYTDRVLKKVFDRHVEKHKGKLKISRMRAILDKLRTDFGISDDPDPFDEEDECVRTVSMLEPDPDVRAARLASQNKPTENIDGTLTSTNTLNFDSTGEAFSTVRSQHRRGSQASEARSDIADRRSLASASRSTIGEKRSETRSQLGDTRSEARSDIADRRSLASASRSTIREKRSETRSQLGDTKSEARSEVSDRRSLASESRSTIGEKRSEFGETISQSGEVRSIVSDLKPEGKQSDVGLGETGEMTATQVLEQYQKTITTQDMEGASRSVSEMDMSERMSSRGEQNDGIISRGEQLSEPDSSLFSSPSHSSQAPVPARRRRNPQHEEKHLPELHKAKVLESASQGEKEITVDEAIKANANTGVDLKNEESIAINNSFKAKLDDKTPAEEVVEDYDDDYEDDYDADDDDGQGGTTHRTSDEDF
ncbi:LOW QUALITY PROTEIN: spermatogenesis-associated protein 7-like [Haliotis rubra]|uniref:LOW QUALITY PROTEIN: spermatogenesis-associated protein 7-like n=1 Tax=Haliotis rubra TaxID=36100 RepID=UPI001EE61EFD|nr:LOW QUALITY PROTEIN: spermatogenesis-associated protein 7-like [Haliotis rubra]